MTNTTNTPRTWHIGYPPCDCSEPTTTYTVPPVFFEDHVDRDCLMHEVTGRTTGGKRPMLQVDLRPCDAAELLSDARHYASSGADYGPDFFGLCASARATVRRLTTGLVTGHACDQPCPTSLDWCAAHGCEYQ